MHSHSYKLTDYGLVVAGKQGKGKKREAIRLGGSESEEDSPKKNKSTGRQKGKDDATVAKEEYDRLKKLINEMYWLYAKMDMSQ